MLGSSPGTMWRSWFPCNSLEKVIYIILCTFTVYLICVPVEFADCKW